MSITKFANAILEPLGLKARNFTVDYQDKKGNDYNNVVVAPPCDFSDNFIVSGIVQDMKQKGYTVTAIFEMLNGYDKAELEEMMEDNPQEAIKHLRLIYRK